MLKSTTTTQLALITLFAAAPLLAQGGHDDPTTAVVGSGQLPPGWSMRCDHPCKPTDVSFVTMGKGFHITSGPAAIYYNSKDMSSGVYGVSATFHQAKSMMRESYGIFVGGSNLQDSTQHYLYMVIRPLDGHLSIEYRSSNASPVSLVAMRTNAEPAVNKDSPTDSSATNTLLIHVAKDTVHFMVNGKLVKAIAKSDLGGAMTDGQAGIRVNHNISVHVDDWAVKK